MDFPQKPRCNLLSAANVNLFTYFNYLHSCHSTGQKCARSPLKRKKKNVGPCRDLNNVSHGQQIHRYSNPDDWRRRGPAATRESECLALNRAIWLNVMFSTGVDKPALLRSGDNCRMTVENGLPIQSARRYYYREWSVNNIPSCDSKRLQCVRHISGIT